MGTTGMETAICNAVEPGEEVHRKMWGQPIPLTDRWGNVISKEAVEKALSNSKAWTVALVHAETTTRALQSLSDIARAVRPSASWSGSAAKKAVRLSNKIASISNHDHIYRFQIL